MGHQEDFEELTKEEALRIPRTVAILLRMRRHSEVTYRGGASILRMMQMDRAAQEAEEAREAAIPHTSHTQRHLHLVGSEEAGTTYIDYGPGPDEAA